MNMKKATQKERVVREEQDPEFKEAFEALNIERLFMEFQGRPTRSTVNEMAEDYMAMDHEKKMSKRDRARAKFVKDFKMKQMVKRSAKNTFIAERERFMDIQE